MQWPHETCAGDDVEGQGTDDQQAAVQAEELNQLVLTSGVDETSKTST